MGGDFSEDPAQAPEVTADWKEVGQAVKARIDELGLTLTEFEERSGVSDASVRKVIRGEGLTRADKKRQLCDGLGWTRDSIDRILHGDEAILTTAGVDSEVARLIATVEARLRALEQQVAELAAADREAP